MHLKQVKLGGTILSEIDPLNDKLIPHSANRPQIIRSCGVRFDFDPQVPNMYHNRVVVHHIVSPYCTGTTYLRNAGYGGMGREDMRKPAISAGKRAFSTGTVPQTGRGLSNKLRHGRRGNRRPFFMAWEGLQRRRRGGCVIYGEGRKTVLHGRFGRKEGRSAPPRKSQQQT